VDVGDINKSATETIKPIIETAKATLANKPFGNYEEGSLEHLLSLQAKKLSFGNAMTRLGSDPLPENTSAIPRAVIILIAATLGLYIITTITHNDKYEKLEVNSAVAQANNARSVPLLALGALSSAALAPVWAGVRTSIFLKGVSFYKEMSVSQILKLEAPKQLLQRNMMRAAIAAPVFYISLNCLELLTGAFTWYPNEEEQRDQRIHRRKIRAMSNAVTGLVSTIAVSAMMIVQPYTLVPVMLG